MRRRQNTLIGTMGIATSIVILCAGPTVSAQGIYAYPAAGQSEQQQRKDNSECHQWARSQTGFDPARTPAPAPTYYASGPSGNVNSGVFGRGQYGEGGGVLDAGKGAGAGALIGAIAGDTGAGAAIGAVSGLFMGAVRRSSAESERDAWERQQAEQQRRQQQAAADNYARGQREFESAFKVCMKSRKYQVN